MRVLTIGGHGFTHRTFVAALHAARVDTLVDLRRRRGMRGAAYAFLNRARLEALLARERIHYVYISELVPTPAIRDLQRAADRRHHHTAHTREQLSPAYVRAFERDVLAHFDRKAFAARVAGAKVVALFCVEGPPELCPSLAGRARDGRRQDAPPHSRVSRCNRLHWRSHAGHPVPPAPRYAAGETVTDPTHP